MKTEHGITIEYLNENGKECSARLLDPLETDHYYYTSKRNTSGKYERVNISRMSVYLKLLKNCSKIRIKQF